MNFSTELSSHSYQLYPLIVIEPKSNYKKVILILKTRLKINRHKLYYLTSLEKSLSTYTRQELLHLKLSGSERSRSRTEPGHDASPH